MTTAYLNDYLKTRVQHSDGRTPASLASDHFRKIGSGGEDVTPIIVPTRITEWDTKIDGLGFILPTRTQ